MPYVVCKRCAARSYVALRARGEQCPVCAAPLHHDHRNAPSRPAAGSPSDAQLADRHRDDDPAAFTTLHDRYAAMLRARARRLVGPAHADDVVQDAFERAHRFLLDDPRACGPDLQLGAWLHTVVQHRCIDELRRTPGQAARSDPSTARNDDPSTVFAQAERMRALRQALLALPDRQRAALVRHVVDGVPHSLVARELQVSVAATKSLVNRARVELRAGQAAA